MLDYLISPLIQIEDYNGKPLTGGRVEVYIHDTSAKYVTFRDFEGHLNEFRVPLNERGECVLIASTENSYDIYIYNSFDAGSPVISRLNVHTMNYDAPEVTTPLPSVSSRDAFTVVANSTRPDGGTNYAVGLAEEFLGRIDTIELNLSYEGSNRVAADNNLQHQIDGKQDALTAGNGISIAGATISIDNTVATKSDVAAAKTTVTAGDNIRIDETTAPDGHKNYRINGVESVPNVTVTSDDRSLSVTTTTAGNNKTFDLSVNGTAGEYICSTGSDTGFVALSQTDSTMIFGADYYRNGITRNGSSFNLKTGCLYHCTAQIILNRATPGNSLDRLWISMFGALVYFNADSSIAGEQSVEISIDALYSSNGAIMMGADESGWSAYINVVCVHRVAGVTGGTPGGQYLQNRVSTMPMGAVSSNYFIPAPDSNEYYYGIGAMIMPEAPLSLAGGLKVSFYYTGGQSDTSHVIALYKARQPLTSGTLDLIATTTDTHNDAWGGLVTETMDVRTSDEIIDPNCIYYIVYALRGYTPISLGGNNVVGAATMPFNAWQYTTLNGWEHGAPAQFTYTNYAFGFVPFCTITGA